MTHTVGYIRYHVSFGLDTGSTHHEYGVAQSLREFHYIETVCTEIYM